MIRPKHLSELPPTGMPPVHAVRIKRPWRGPVKRNPGRRPNPLQEPPVDKGRRAKVIGTDDEDLQRRVKGLKSQKLTVLRVDFKESFGLSTLKLKIKRVVPRPPTS